MEAFWARKTFPESFSETSGEALQKKTLSLHFQQVEKQLLLKRLKYLNVLCLWELKGISWDMVIQAWKRNTQLPGNYLWCNVLLCDLKGISATQKSDCCYIAAGKFIWQSQLCFYCFLLIKKKNPLFSFRHVFQLKIWKPKWHFHSEINGCVFLNKQFWILIWVSQCIIYIYAIIWKILPHSYPRIFLKPRKAIFQKITLYF